MLLPSSDGKFPQLLVGHIRSYLGEVGLGDGTVVKVGCMRTMNGIFIGVEGIGAAQFTMGCPVRGDEDLTALARNFHFATWGQAANFSDMINDQVDPGGGSPRFGHYNANFCEEHDNEEGNGD